MSQTISTFAQLKEHGICSDTAHIDLILTANITIEGRVEIAPGKVLHFGDYQFSKAFSSATTGDVYDLEALNEADSSFDGASGHAMLTVVLGPPGDQQPKRPRAGTTVTIEGVSTGSGGYDGTWEVLASSAVNGSAHKAKIVIARAYTAASVSGSSKVKAASIEFNGRIATPEWNRQYFSGFNPGDIRGTFGGEAEPVGAAKNYGGVHEIYPEWWGLERVSGQLLRDGGLHDQAINCAIKSVTVDKPAYDPADPDRSLVMALRGRVVRLAEGIYFISAPLDLSSSLSVLRGAGDGRTEIQATTGWDQSKKSWYDSSVWPRVGVVPGKENHSALVWIGAGLPGGYQSFRTGVAGVNINCYNATWSAKGRDGTGRVSGISSKGWVEENSVIENVRVEYFSGFGIGFGPRAAGYIATVNGLTVRNFWIATAARRDAYPIYLSFHAAVTSFDTGTVDVTLKKPASAAWEEGYRAAGVLHLTGNPEDGDTVTLGEATYRIVDTLTQQNDVKRVAPPSGKPQPGAQFSSAMTPHPSLLPVLNTGANPDQLDLYAATAGAAWNLFSLWTDIAGGYFKSGANWNLKSATLTGGTDIQLASGSFRFNDSNLPVPGTRITLGPKTYKFVAELTENLEGNDATDAKDGEVLIGATTAVTLANLAAAFWGAVTEEGQRTWSNLVQAINGTGVHGTTYHSGPYIPHPVVSARGAFATQIIGCPLTASPAYGDTITVSGYQYQFTYTLSGPHDILIRETEGTGDLPGTTFSAAMSPHPTVDADLDGAVLNLTARIVGHSANEIALVSESTYDPPTVPLFSTPRLSEGNSSDFASAQLEFGPGGNAQDGESVSVDGKKYVFRDELTSPPLDGEVLIGQDGTSTLLHLANAFKGAAWVTLKNLQAALNGGPSTDAYHPGTGTPNASVTAASPSNNSIRLTSREPLLISNWANVSSGALLVGGPYLAGGAPLAQIAVTAKEGGTGGNVGVAADTDAANWGSAETLEGGEEILEPSYIFDWPMIAIHAQGQHTVISNVHIEGAGIGINVVGSDGRSTVTLSNIDVYEMMEGQQIYSADPTKEYYPAPELETQKIVHPSTNPYLHPHYWHYSCAVLISSKHGEGYNNQNNPKDRVVISNVVSAGGVRFLLRDASYGKEISAYGWGQFPNGSSAGIVFYLRTDGYAPAAGVPPYAHPSGDFNSAPTAKTYFFGPVI